MIGFLLLSVFPQSRWGGTCKRPRSLASGSAPKSFRWLIMPPDSGCPVWTILVDYYLEALQYQSRERVVEGKHEEVLLAMQLRHIFA